MDIGKKIRELRLSNDLALEGLGLGKPSAQ